MKCVTTQDSPPKQLNKNRERPRFSPNDIVRAIEGVEAAGLEIYSVEITPSGAINIRTSPLPETPAASPIDMAAKSLRDLRIAEIEKLDAQLKDGKS